MSKVKFTEIDAQNIEWAAAFVDAVMSSSTAKTMPETNDWQQSFGPFHERLLNAIQEKLPIQALMLEEYTAALACTKAAVECFRILKVQQPDVAATFPYPGEFTMQRTVSRIKRAMNEYHLGATA